MNEDFNNETSSNRFIFSNDFYDQLESIPLEQPVSFDAPLDKVEIEIPKMEEVKVDAVPVNNPTVPIPTMNPHTENQKDDVVDIPQVDYIESKSKVFEPSEVLSTVSTVEEEAKFPVAGSSEDKVANNFSSLPHDDTISSNIIIPEMVQSQEELVLVPQQNIQNSVPELESHSVLDSDSLKQDDYLNHIDVTSEEEKLNTSPASEFDTSVEEKTDNKMEKLLMRTKIESESKPAIVEDYGRWEPEKQEKSVYRATRNQPQEIPIWLRDDVEIPVYVPPKVLTDTSVYIQPEVINIDEEILKEVDDVSTPNHTFNYDGNLDSPVVMKSDLLEKLKMKEEQTGKFSILARYGEDFCSKDYVTNPAIGRQEEIKQVNLILLTPEKSVILVGKPGIGKTSIVEGLAYQLQRGNVPDVLKGYRIISIKTISLLGTLPTGETRLQTLIDELRDLDKVILFMDEIHMLMGATNESGLDFANMFKESLGRGTIKMIGATTSDEYERYVLRDKAFVRRFQRVDVEEPTMEQTVKILMGTLPKIEKSTGARLKYNEFIQTEIMRFIVEITTEYKRVYGIGSRYPDICLTLLSQAFSQAVFDNRTEVGIMDVRRAIENSKNIYPDVIKKELINFDEKFNNLITQ